VFAMLKRLELVGFKSFADKTQFDFAAGVTGIVGPNGSGKSNVVDAVRWVLGEQSAKSLRGGEMTDVIFNGSATRRSLGLAEVTMTFDNSRRVLATEADEVQIGRRVYRGGEGEYLINGQVCRLKDVKDLFLGSGAGAGIARRAGPAGVRPAHGVSGRENARIRGAAGRPASGGGTSRCLGARAAPAGGGAGGAGRSGARVRGGAVGGAATDRRRGD